MFTITTATFSLFQFHYGTIKSFDRKGNVEEKTNFNSTMVRLKDNAINFLMVLNVYFNSTMVRLKVYRLPTNGMWTQISIPLWYD